MHPGRAGDDEIHKYPPANFDRTRPPPGQAASRASEPRPRKVVDAETKPARCDGFERSKPSSNADETIDAVLSKANVGSGTRCM